MKEQTIWTWFKVGLLAQVAMICWTQPGYATFMLYLAADVATFYGIKFIIQYWNQ